MSASTGDGKWQVEVRVDGEPVELGRAFIHEMIGSSVEGLLAALRGVDDPSKIEIHAVRMGSDDSQD